MLWVLQVWLLLICMWPRGMQAEVLRLKGDLKTVNLSSSLELWIDSKARSEVFATLPAELSLTVPGASDLAQIGPHSIAWARLQLENESKSSQSLVFWVDGFFYPLHIYEKQGEALRFLAGVSPTSPQPYVDHEHGNISYRFVLGPGERKELYLQFSRPLSPPSLPFLLSSEQSWNNKQKYDFMVRALLIGIGLVILALNVSLYVRLREESYLYYCLYVFFYLLSYSMAYRVMHSLVDDLWVRAFHIQWESFVIQLCHIFILLFSSRFLRLPEQDRFFAKLFQICVYLELANLFAIIPFPVASRIFIDTAQLVLGVLIMIVALRSVRRGYRPALYFSVGWGAVILGSTLTLMAGLGYLEPNYGTTWAVAYAVAFEMFILSLGLGDRMYLLEEEAKQKKLEQEKREAAFRDEIVALNGNLNERVREQTQDIQTMMQHIKLGIFTIGTDLRIQKDYTSYLENILEQKDFEGSQLFAVLFRNAELGSDEKSKITNALEYSLKEHEMFFEANKDNLPRDLELKFPQGHRKFIELDWYPVINQMEFVDKILVAMRDVSETIHLRQEAEEGRKELLCLAEVLKLGNKRFERFRTSFQEIWSDLDDIMDYARSTQSLHEMDIQRLFQSLHTLKGSSRLAGLSVLTDAIHEAEELLTAKEVLKSKDFDKLEQRLRAIQDAFATYRAIRQPLLESETLLEPTASQHQARPTLFRLLEEAKSMLFELAQLAGKGSCRFQIDIPSDMNLEESVYHALSHSLVHLLSNTLDHGIESPEERVAKGLPPEGTVRVFWDSAGRLCFADDGLGLSLPKLREKAARIGWKKLSDTDVVDVILEPGVSTRENATLSSGRGVGLSAVRSLLKAVGADIEVVPLEKRGETMIFCLAIEFPIQALQRAS